jgi:diguanylate cyclase (GGDEF)-like protein
MFQLPSSATESPARAAVAPVPPSGPLEAGEVGAGDVGAGRATIGEASRALALACTAPRLACVAAAVLLALPWGVGRHLLAEQQALRDGALLQQMAFGLAAAPGDLPQRLALAPLLAGPGARWWVIRDAEGTVLAQGGQEQVPRLAPAWVAHWIGPSSSSGRGLGAAALARAEPGDGAGAAAAAAASRALGAPRPFLSAAPGWSAVPDWALAAARGVGGSMSGALAAALGPATGQMDAGQTVPANERRLPATDRTDLQLAGAPVQLQVQAASHDLVDQWWSHWLLLAVTVAGAGVVSGLLLRLQQRRDLADASRQRVQLLQRQQELFDGQAAQLELLRRQIHTDEVTGLPNRRHFVAVLQEQLLAQGEAAQAGLLLLRVRDLAGLNQRIGHAQTDQALQLVARTLQSYPQRIPRCAAGRLNGADFGLLLPVAGLAAETADSLLQGLRAALAPLALQTQVVIGAVELERCQGATAALAAADAALAEAELMGGYVLASSRERPVMGELVGEVAWQRRIRRALMQGRVGLGEFPVCTPDGRVLHLDCPLRVQLMPGGPFEPAQRWLALAVRSRLATVVDDKAVALALEAIARDGIARCVNISAQALAFPEFVAGICRRLEQAPDAACRLWLDVPEALAMERPLLLREVARRWRPLGAMLALEHAGEDLARIPRLMDLGLDCIRIDARFVNGIAEPQADDRRRYLQGLVRLVQSVGLQITAEGVRQLADLEQLWALGFDAATGPALRPPADDALPTEESPRAGRLRPGAEPSVGRPADGRALTPASRASSTEDEPVALA